MSDQSSLPTPLRQKLLNHIKPYLPGLMLSATIAAAATFLSEHYTTPVMMLALLIGMAFNFLSDDTKCQKGINFASTDLLRIGIILLGARITLVDISSLGVTTFFIILSLVILTISSGFLFAKIFRKEWQFGLLTGGAVAICGASAALAIAALLPKNSTAENDEKECNTLFTVIAVTTFSTIAMVLYPILFTMLDLTPRETGFLIGATIHDVAQVIGAGYTISLETGDTATIVKLLRVALLPVVLIVLLLTSTVSEKRQKELSASPETKPKLPFFVVGFLLVVLINSFGLLPQTLLNIMIESSRWFLVIAISALGIKTSMQKMLQLGYGHIGVVLCETITLLLIAILVVKLLQPV